MMDKFKETSFKMICKGGDKCPCCNPFYYDKKRRQKLNKTTRRILKQEDKKEDTYQRQLEQKREELEGLK